MSNAGNDCTGWMAPGATCLTYGTTEPCTRCRRMLEEMPVDAANAIDQHGSAQAQERKDFETSRGIFRRIAARRRPT